MLLKLVNTYLPHTAVEALLKGNRKSKQARCALFVVFSREKEALNLLHEFCCTSLTKVASEPDRKKERERKGEKQKRPNKMHLNFSTQNCCQLFCDGRPTISHEYYFFGRSIQSAPRIQSSVSLYVSVNFPPSPFSDRLLIDGPYEIRANFQLLLRLLLRPRGVYLPPPPPPPPHGGFQALLLCKGFLHSRNPDDAT